MLLFIIKSSFHIREGVFCMSKVYNHLQGKKMLLSYILHFHRTSKIREIKQQVVGREGPFASQIVYY